MNSAVQNRFSRAPLGYASWEAVRASPELRRRPCITSKRFWRQRPWRLLAAAGDLGQRRALGPAIIARSLRHENFAHRPHRGARARL